ncbi:MAG: hypothetical protein K0Q51_1475 [Rickettsiaceae bacterium]|jgi:hypothetical protein|nr:hypothetical protein [Rickettsiaceae bacterium]
MNKALVDSFKKQEISHLPLFREKDFSKYKELSETNKIQDLLVNFFIKLDYTVQHANELTEAIKEYYIRKLEYRLRSNEFEE